MGDLTTIYPEIPADRTAKRTEDLLRGIEFYLAKERD